MTPEPRAPQGPAGPTPKSSSQSVGTVLAHALWVAKKDLQVEWRSREILLTMAFFGALVVVIFSFAFSHQGQPSPQMAGGVLWVVVLFTGTLGLGRVFEREREGGTHLALMLSPASPAAIYLGKLLAVLCFMAVAETVVVLLLVLFFNVQVATPLSFLALLFLGTLGFAALGSLFAATLLQSRARDVLLSIVLFPLSTPLMIAGAKGTAALLATPADSASALIWIKLLLAFDVVFVTLSFWVFGPLTRSD